MGINFTIEQIKDIFPPETAPMFEARFKLVNKILKESEITQILELASGFSQRGFIISQDPLMKYSELDLPGIIEEKKSIAKNLIEKGKIKKTTNLHLNKGNTIIMEDLLSATQEFEENKPIAVLNEGLLRYLDYHERTKVAENIHQLLKESGGVWITPDSAVKMRRRNSSKLMYDSDEKIKQLTGIDVRKYYFKNELEAKKFFEGFGFSVERRNFMEVYSELVSPKNLNLLPEVVKKILQNRSVFIMKVKKVGFIRIGPDGVTGISDE